MGIAEISAMLKARANREQLYCTAQYWDSKAELFSDASVSMWPNNHLNVHYHSEQIAWLDRYIGAVRGKRLLDAGCGTGRLSRHYAEQGAEVTGFDFSARSIELALKCSKGNNPSYRVQSVFELNERRSYDVVIVWGMLTVACRNRAQLLSALICLREALIPGGRFLVMEPIHQGFLHRVLKLGTTEFVSVMQEAGFTIQNVTNLHFWPARLALAYIPFPRWLTALGYYTGQTILMLLRRKGMGDYKAICATA